MFELNKVSKTLCCWKFRHIYFRGLNVSNAIFIGMGDYDFFTGTWKKLRHPLNWMIRINEIRKKLWPLSQANLQFPSIASANYCSGYFLKMCILDRFISWKKIMTPCQNEPPGNWVIKSYSYLERLIIVLTKTQIKSNYWKFYFLLVN